MRLQALGSFALRLKASFEIDGPDGPEPQRDTLEFHFNFMLSSSD